MSIEIEINQDLYILFPMKDETDFNTYLTSISTGAFSIQVLRSQGTWASVSNTNVTNKGSGWYQVKIPAANIDTLGEMGVQITAAGAANFDDRYVVRTSLASETTYAVTVADAQRIAAILFTTEMPDIISHPDAVSANIGNEAKPNHLLNAVQYATGRVENTSGEGLVYLPDKTTVAVRRTIRIADAGSEYIGGLS